MITNLAMSQDFKKKLGYLPSLYGKDFHKAITLYSLPLSEDYWYL